MSQLQIEVFADGLVMPEGPVAMADGSVILVEIGAGRITRCWAGGRKETVATPGGGPNGAAIGADGALYVCNNGGVDHEKMCHVSGPGHEGRIERIDLASGRVERLYEACAGEPLSAPNDLVIDAAGDIWFSDLGKHLVVAQQRGGVFHATPDGGSIRCVDRSIMGCNGVGLSPDGATVYVAECFSGRVVAFDAKSGEPGGGRRFVGHVESLATLDSLAVTAAGNICVACPSTHQIATFTPSGAVGVVDLPQEYPTNLAFGGEDMRTAFVTMTGSGKLLRLRWPEAGLPLSFNA